MCGKPTKVEQFKIKWFTLHVMKGLLHAEVLGTLLKLSVMGERVPVDVQFALHLWLCYK